VPAGCSLLTELNGFFSLRTPLDLREKLEVDFARLIVCDPISKEAQYAAFDFFVTANHMADWQEHSNPGTTVTEHRQYPDGLLVEHVAVGAKHFRVRKKTLRDVRDTRAESGGFQPGTFQPSAFQVPHLVIDLENGDTVAVLDVARRVIDHWRTAVPER